MGPAVFGIAALLTLLGASAFAVYSFDFIEPAWGYGGSLQVLWMISVALAFLATITYGFSSALLRRFHTNGMSAAAGIVSALCLVAVAALLPPGLKNAWLYGLAALLLASAASPLFAQRPSG